MTTLKVWLFGFVLGLGVMAHVRLQIEIPRINDELKELGQICELLDHKIMANHTERISDLEFERNMKSIEKNLDTINRLQHLQPKKKHKEKIVGQPVHYWDCP
jgi:hypothetical protein